jgi:hypothetical protein
VVEFLVLFVKCLCDTSGLEEFYTGSLLNLISKDNTFKNSIRICITHVLHPRNNNNANKASFEIELGPLDFNKQHSLKIPNIVAIEIIGPNKLMIFFYFPWHCATCTFFQTF